jgi:hypothetical protein
MIFETSTANSFSSMTWICKEEVELNEWRRIALIAIYFGAAVWNGQLCSFTVPSETFPPNVTFCFELKHRLAVLETTFDLKLKPELFQLLEEGFTWVHHTSTFPFSSADASNRPSGEKATDRTQPECPGSLRGLVAGPSTWRSQTNTSPFQQPLHRNWNEWTNKSKKVKWTNPAMHQRVFPASALLCKSNESIEDLPLRSVTTGFRRSTDQICQMQKRRKELQQLMDIVPVGVTLTDPSVEQLASRPSSALHRRDSTLPYLMRVRRGFGRLIHSFTWWSKFFKGSDWYNWRILIVSSSEQEAKASAEIQITSLIPSEWEWQM